MKNSYLVFLSLVLLGLLASTPVVPVQADISYVGSYKMEWNVYYAKSQSTGGRWKFMVEIKVWNRANTLIHIPWFYVYFYNVTYTDGTSEDYGLTSNSTTNYSIKPDDSIDVSVEFTQLGFPKEPADKGIQYRILIYIAEAASSLEIYTIRGIPVPEFSANPIVAFTVTLAVALLTIHTRTKFSRLSHDLSES